MFTACIVYTRYNGVAVYYNFSLTIISLKHIKNGCPVMTVIKLKISFKNLPSLLNISFAYHAHPFAYKDG